MLALAYFCHFGNVKKYVVDFAKNDNNLFSTAFYSHSVFPCRLFVGLLSILDETRKRNLSMEIGIWLFDEEVYSICLFHSCAPNKHTRTSRYHPRWQCYALNRFRMPFKFVQNTSILLAMRCGIYIFHMAHTQMIQNRPMGFATIQKSNLQFPLGMLTLSLSLPHVLCLDLECSHSFQNGKCMEFSSFSG